MILLIAITIAIMPFSVQNCSNNASLREWLRSVAANADSATPGMARDWVYSAATADFLKTPTLGSIDDLSAILDGKDVDLLKGSLGVLRGCENLPAGTIETAEKLVHHNDEEVRDLALALLAKHSPKRFFAIAPVFYATGNSNDRSWAIGCAEYLEPSNSLNSLIYMGAFDPDPWVAAYAIGWSEKLTPQYRIPLFVYHLCRPATYFPKLISLHFQMEYDLRYEAARMLIRDAHYVESEQIEVIVPVLERILKEKNPTAQSGLRIECMGLLAQWGQDKMKWREQLIKKAYSDSAILATEAIDVISQCLPRADAAAELLRLSRDSREEIVRDAAKRAMERVLKDD